MDFIASLGGSVGKMGRHAGHISRNPKKGQTNLVFGHSAGATRIGMLDEQGITHFLWIF
jgi:hypothetical protein